MEKNKQLNLSAPFLSVRRHSSPRATTDGLDRKVIENSQQGRQRSHPVNKSVMESEAVTKPASVPFIWENAPGRPKGESTISSREDSPITPRLPPGRLSDAGRRSGEVYSPRLPRGRLSTRHRSGELDNPRLPPGRLSGEMFSPHLYPTRLTSKAWSPRLNPGKLADVRWRSGEVQTQRLASGRLSNLRHLSGEVSMELNSNKYQSEAFAVTDHASLLESLKQSLNADAESEVGSEEDDFSDALDTLSPTESLSLNCSVTGLGNFSEGQNCVQSESFSVDPQARDLMMRRFLTASKAAVLETPQHVSKKQSGVIEEPKIVEKVISMERKKLSKQPVVDPAPIFIHFNDDVKSEDEISFDEPEKRIGKGCGLFPRLCVRNSLSILRQGSENKSKTQPSTPSPAEVKKLTRNGYSGMKLKTQTSSPSSGKVKNLTRNAYSGPLDKCASDAIYKKKYHSGNLSQELHRISNKLMDDPKRISSSSDLYKMAEERSSSTRSRSGAISPYRNERSTSPFREGARFLGLPKEVELKAEKISSLIRRDKIILEVSSLRSHRQRSEPSGMLVEKTLYEDAWQSRATPNINSERSPISSNKVETKSRSGRTPPHSASKSSREDIKRQLALEQGSGEHSESILSSLTCNSKLSGPMHDSKLAAHEILKCFSNQHLDQENNSLELNELKGNGNLVLKKNASNRELDGQTENSTLLLSPLPPPLPKSPSESWLWGTLPSISLRNPFSHSRGSPLHSKRQSPSPKWETMVKSSKVHNDHVRYSEELVSHIPRQDDRR
ncbi:hypothetical protein Leryth_022292 [Lithospermum erythrorhizon]|nr:hypothetical protein Leryth_022292 [Lithospermum erythrorhizon]